MVGLTLYPAASLKDYPLITSDIRKRVIVVNVETECQPGGFILQAHVILPVYTASLGYWS